MTVAADTNVLLDILSRDAQHYASSQSRIRDAVHAGNVIVSEPVFAELSPRLSGHGGVTAFLTELGIAFEPSQPEALHRAGTSFREYLQRRRGFRCPECGGAVEVRCPSCGADVTRWQHILADFMIGAHALVHAGRLLTRDRGYYGTYFPDLTLV